MTEKLQFLKYKKLIPEKPFLRITYRRIPVILERFSRLQGVLGVLEVGIGSSFGKFNKFINKIINFPRGVYNC